MRTSKHEVRRLAKSLGMEIETQNPGDGQTRYTFTWGRTGAYSKYVRGSWNAWMFLLGFECGKNNAEEEKHYA